MRSDIIKSVQDMYNDAGVYFSKTRSKRYGQNSSQNWPVTQKYLDTLQKGEAVLDVGCGNGRLVSGLPKGVEYLGIDFSDTLLNEAKSNFPDNEFRYGNIVEEDAWEKLHKFEAVFCVAVLHHIPEKEQQIYVLKQIKSHLKKNGFLYLTVWNLWQEKFMQHHLDSLALKKTNPRWVEIPFNKNWKRFCVQMDIPYLVEIMKEANLDVEEIFFAGRDGEKSDIRGGQNLVVIAR